MTINNMWLRFISISALKWVVMNCVIVLVSLYLIPRTWHGYAIIIPMWLITFACAFGFATWALSKRLPSWRDLGWLVVIWLVVSLILQNVYEQLLFGYALWFLRSLDLLLGFVIEILAIVLAFYFVRRNKIKASLPKGMVA